MASSVTVAIATYNGARHLRTAIESAIATGARVLISDDASTDESVAIAQSYGSRGVTVFTRDANAGIQANYQFLLEQCESPLALFLNQDDALYPGRLRGLKLSSHHVTVLNSWIIDDQSRKIRLMYRRPPYHALVDGVYSALCQTSFFKSPSQAIFPVAPALEQGGFVIPEARGQGAEDWMCWLRLASAEVPFRFHMWPRVAYRVHAGNYSHHGQSHQSSAAAVRTAIPAPPTTNSRLQLRW